MQSRLVRCLWMMLVAAACVLSAVLSAAPAFAQNDPRRAAPSGDGLKVLLGAQVLLQSDRDAFMSVHRVIYSPTGRHFVVIGCGFECTDNVGFLFSAEGGGKRKFTARWDHVLQDKVEWSADGTKLYYYRINSTGADSPRGTPPEGWVEVSIQSGAKRSAASRRLKTGTDYSVFNASDDLAVRSAPGTSAKEVGRLARDAKGVRVTGVSKQSGRGMWVPIQHQGVTGWVNQSFLFEEVGAVPTASTLDALAGQEWVLRSWKSGEQAPQTPAVTLTFVDGKFAGGSGCNRYSGAVTAGAAPGAIKVGPTISTQMACPEPASSLETRFLRQLEAVNKFALSAGRLELSYEMTGASGVMMFEKRP